MRRYLSIIIQFSNMCHTLYYRWAECVNGGNTDGCSEDNNILLRISSVLGRVKISARLVPTVAYLRAKFYLGLHYLNSVT